MILQYIFFPLLGGTIFLSLFGIMYFNSLPQSLVVPVGFGLFAFSLMVLDIIVALRLKVFEKWMGLPLMYHIHGFLGMAAICAALVHVIMELKGGIFSFRLLPSSISGKLGMLFLIAVILTGILSLSNIYTRRFSFLNDLKERIIKREKALWLHRFAVASVFLIYIHMLSFRFVRNNTALVVLLTFYVVISVGGYIWQAWHKDRAPKYKLAEIKQHNSDVYELGFEPLSQKLMDYQAGQFIFVKFIKSVLPSESHPFSITTSRVQKNGRVNVMIKKAGDFTGLISKLRIGDLAQLEGPYGNFMKDYITAAHNPLVILAGGIGITPGLSILREQMTLGSKRKMVLIWALSLKKDLMLIEELEKFKLINPFFSYNITFSQDVVENFAKGRIDEEFLRQSGVDDSIINSAEFFICGPDKMMTSTKCLLESKKVERERIHLEEFAF